MADVFGDSAFGDKYDRMHYWLNLSNAAGEQVELVAKARDKQKQSGVPVGLTRAEDNRDDHPDTNGRVAPNLRDAILRDPGMAAYFKDELPKWDAFARRVFGMGSEDVFMQAVENEIGVRGLASAEGLAETRRESYLNDRFRNSWDDRPRSRSFRAAVVEAAREQQKASVLEEIDKTSRINAIIHAFDLTLPGWREGDDKQLRRDLNHATGVLGIKTDDITLGEMRETKGYDYEEAFNFFGVQDIAKAIQMATASPEFTPEELAKVDENSPLELQLAKLRMLQEERDSLKESTWGERVVNGVLMSIPFVAEFALAGATGLVSVAGRSPELAIKMAMKGMGLKMLYRHPGMFVRKAAKAVGIAAAGAAQRIPLYLPKNAAQAMNEKYYGGSVTMPIGDGKLQIEVPEEKVSNLFEGFISNVISQYIENMSEDLGALVPLGDLDAKMVAAIFPKKVRSAVMQKLAWNPATKRLFQRVVMENVPFNGAWGEFAEEEIGNMMAYFATAMLEAVGFDPDNTPGTQSLFMGGQESLDTAATIALQSMLFRGFAAIPNNTRGRGVISLIENKNRVEAQGKRLDELVDMIQDTRLVSANLSESVETITTLRGGDAVLHIEAEDARGILMQAVEADDQETLGALQEAGITKETVDRAAKKGDDILVSQNLLMGLGANKKYKTGRDVMHKLWDLSASSVFGANVKDLTGSSFEKKELDRLAEQSAEDRKFMTDVRKTVLSSLTTAAQNARDAGVELGNETVRNWVSIINVIQNYIAGETEAEGREEVKKMLTGLSVKFIENPEAFDPKTALAQIVPVDRIKQKRKQKQWAPVYDAYDLALQMERNGASPEAIRQATGWERVEYGDSSILVYDMPDNYKPSGKLLDAMKNGVDVSELTFEECFEATPELKKLYSLYPYLKKAGLKVVKVVPATNTKSAIAAYDWYRNRFYLSEDIPEDLIPFAIAHEVQHYIQRTGMGLDHRAGDSWISTPTELNAIDASYRGTLSDEDRRNKTIASTSRDAIEATIAMQKDYSRRKKRIDQKELGANEEEAALPKRRVDTTTVYVDGKKVDDWDSNPGLLFIVTWIRRGGEKRLQKEIDNLRDEVSIIESGDSVPPHLSGRLADIKHLLGEIETFKQRVDVERTHDFTGQIPGRGLETRHDLFQKENDRIYRGAINLQKFNRSREAVITLFKNANASTMVHESAHWLKAMMDALVEGGFATPKMAEDAAKIDRWLETQDYSKEAAEKYGLLFPNGEANKEAMREEYFARAFEAYVRDGKFPQGAERGLKAALHRLARMLRTIYLEATKLNVTMGPEIKEFFDGLFAADYAAQEQSTLADILRSINEGALAMSKAELNDLEKAVAGAREDAQVQAYLNALRDYRDGLRAQKPIWRADAKEAYAASKAEKAYTYVRNGHKFDENFLRNVLKLDEETISILKRKRLVGKSAAPVADEGAQQAATSEATPPVSVESTPLDGTPEQFDGLANDAYISLPEGEEAKQNVIANLVHGPDGKGGTIWKKIRVNPAGMEFGDALYKVYEAALQLFSKSEPVTKKGLLSYLSTSVFNANKQAYRDEARKPDSLDETVYEGKEGDEMSRYDVTPDDRSTRVVYGTTTEAYLTALSDFTDTLKEGSLKREIADIIYELADAGENATREAILAEYENRGGTYKKTALYEAIDEVRTELNEYLSKNNYFQAAEAALDVPADIMATMRELGYDDVMRLIGDLKLAVGERQFIRDYMERKAEEYKNDFIQNSPMWNTEAGVVEYLDAILKALKLTTGMKFSERVRLEEDQAAAELRGRTVREVMSGLRSLETSLRTSAARILKAVKNNKEDKAAATTAALSMHRHAAQLNAARKLQDSVRKAIRSANRMGSAEAGKSIDGDYLNAILAVRNYFGMSRRQPKWTTGENDPHTVGGVLRKYFRHIVEVELGETDTTSDRHEALYNAAYEAEKSKWTPWLWGVIHGEGPASMDFRDLTIDQFDEVMNFLDFLDGAGRDIRGEAKASFGRRVRNAVNAIVERTMAHNGKRTGQKFQDQSFAERIRALAQGGLNLEKTLVSLADMLDEYTEHYGDQKIGPWRKLFQMPLSAGISKELFWQQKTSTAIKPHLRALMNAAKDRKLTAPVASEFVGGYTELHGEAMAFVLLNAGCLENRERLMSGFGWSEDELNDILKQFTAEDFKHAEAIWAALKEMGDHVAGVFYNERHYRMPRAANVPIELTNNAGETIFSEGGYYPISYKVKKNVVGSTFDIMKPESIMARPTPPSSTYERQPHVEGQLNLDPSVLTRHVAENARYIGMWEPLRLANAIWTNQEVKDAVLLNYGPETYKTIRNLMEQVNNPDRETRGDVFARWGSAILATSALGYKLSPVLSQLQSITVGVERLKGQFWKSFVAFTEHPVEMRRMVANLSPFMRDRYSQRDRDLKSIGTEFSNPLIKAIDKYRAGGFFALKMLDLHVAGIQWWAAYNWALSSDNGLNPKEAAIYADDFVAQSQGAARAIDVPEVQLNPLMRTLTPFFGPAVAAFNSRMAVIASLKKMSVGEAVEAVTLTILLPAILAGVKNGLLQGPSSGDDDDDWGRVERGFIRGLLSDTVSGIPIVQDVADAAVWGIQTNGRTIRSGNVLEASTLRPANDLAKDSWNFWTNLDNPRYASYLGVSIVSECLGMPFMEVYENWERFVLRHFGDSNDKTTEQKLKQQGGKR